MPETKMEKEDWLEARYLGSVAVMLREREAKIAAQIKHDELILSYLRSDLIETQSHAAAADAAIETFAQTLGAKYGLQDGDKIHFETGQIFTQETPTDGTADTATETV